MDSLELILFLPALAADLFWGDALSGRYHPVIWIGFLIEQLEKGLYPGRRDTDLEFRRGLYVVLITLAMTIAGISLLLYLSFAAGFMIHSVVLFFLLYALLACGGLAREAQKVIKDLEEQGLEAGRMALSRIVGRETAGLEADGIYRAVIETVAENFSDGVVAPLFYLFLGGLPLAWLYKAVNTLDSMLGYKNERYLHFGRAAARLDDLLNYLPARISALVIIAGGFFQGLDWRSGWRIMKRDRYAHSSPNSAWPEAAMAGLLGVQLGGDNIYHGRLVRKPSIGEALEPVSGDKVEQAIKNLYLGTVLLAGLLFLAGGLWQI